MTTTAPISREALRLAREQQKLSQRELGRRVAARLGRADATRALQVRLSRIEKGDEIAEEDRELVDALATELALGDGDLGVPPSYVWVRTATGEPSFLALSLRMLVFSSPEKAFDARDSLALQIAGATPMQDAVLVPIHQKAVLNDVLDFQFGQLTERERETVVAVDPDPDALRYLYVLQQAISGGVLEFTGEAAKVYGEREDLCESAAELAFESPPFESDLVALHSLALRRLQDAPPAAAHLLEGWKLEEQSLMNILDRVHKLRHEQRDAQLRQSDA